MTGSESNPRVTTLAPTIPVLAPINAPTNTTDMAKPPLVFLYNIFIAINNSSAIFVFSKTKPIKINNGTASKF